MCDQVLTLFDMGCFEGMMTPPPLQFITFVFIALMIMKFGTGIKLDVFYTMVTKKFVTLILLHNYDIIACA